MAAAARVGDSTSQGTVIIGPGIPTVMIGGMPAAVMGDLHASPVQPSAIPPTPFIIGSTTVMIGGRPALRITDPCALGAMPLVGCPTVMIGG